MYGHTMLVAEAIIPAPTYRDNNVGAPIIGIKAGAVRANVSILMPKCVAS